MEYEIWHDENKNNGCYCHGILFVPLNEKTKLLHYLKQIRKSHGLSDFDEFKVKGVHKYKKHQSFLRNCLLFFSYIIQSNPKENFKIFNINLMDKRLKNIEFINYKPFLEITEKFNCKFGVLKIPDNLKALCCQNYSKKVELTFNFVLKSCCHSMFNQSSPIEINKFYFDGCEHHKGNIDISRILRGQWRDYIKISDNVLIDATQRKERDCDSGILIDFVDNVIGAWCKIIDDPSALSYEYLMPLKEIYKRANENKIFKIKESRWYKTISFSQLEILNGSLKFTDVWKENEHQSSLGI